MAPSIPDPRVAYRVVRAPGRALVHQAVRLHLDALDRGVLTALGGGFLRALYDELLRREDAFLVAALDGDRLAGFILGTPDARRLTRAVALAPHRFVPHVLWAVLRRPRIVLTLLETVRYGGKTGSSIVAELLVIAVDAAMRSRGIGRRLVATLDEEMRARGIGAYKVTVHHAMTDAVRFYETSGFVAGPGFRLYGLDWDLFVRDLSVSGPSPS